jgi:prepilin-type N-terminal cleavage/methylation domain-containing protein
MMRTGRTRRGFTLVEAIAAVTVLGTLGSVASAVIFSAVQSYRDACVVAQLHEEGSSAMEVVARQLRVIPQALSGGPDISAVTPSSIVFGTSSLTLSGTDLVWVNAGGGPVTLLSGVSAFVIECFDGSNVAMAGTLTGSECAGVRRISVTITLSRDGESDTIRTRVFLRGFIEGAIP